MRRLVRRQKRIESWMRDTISSERYKAFDDLHIDQVDQEFQEQAAWLDGSITCLEIALAIRNKERWPFSVAVGLSLVSGNEPIGVSFVDVAELARHLDHSPPSLYIFARNAEPWTTDHDFRQLGAQYLPRSNFPMVTLLREWYDEHDMEYRRSFWLAG